MYKEKYYTASPLAFNLYNKLINFIFYGHLCD